MASCVDGAASAPIDFASTTGPSYINAAGVNGCDGTHLTPEWSVPANDATKKFYFRVPVPVGHTGNWFLTTVFRSAATSGSATVQPMTACVDPTATQVPDNPTFVNTSGTLVLTPSGTTLANVQLQSTFSVTCADGADLYLYYTFTANTISAPLAFSRITLSIQRALP
jgi:hypothetical protein